MWNRTTSITVAATTAFIASACGPDVVPNPVTPQDARAEVIAAARDIVTILHAEVAEAKFSYDSCNDQGDPPFRGTVNLLLWMPGVPHTQPADSKAVIQALTARGWSTDSDFVSHSPTLRKDKINTIVTIAHPPPAGEKLGAHVSAEVDGQCRDTFDHRTDHTILPVDVEAEVRPS